MRDALDLGWYAAEGFGDPFGAEAPRGQPLVINAALTGGVFRRRDTPHLPIAPREIVADAERCFRAGARVLHLHARDEAGEPTWEAEQYGRLIPEIRSRCEGVIVCATTTGRTFRAFRRRAAVLALEGAAKPDAASLTPGSMNFPRRASVNSPSTIRRLAQTLAARGIAAEVEVFEVGMINYAQYLERKGILRAPRYFNLILGSLGTMPARVRDLEYLVSSFPGGAAWMAAGIGRFQLPVNVAAILRGGHVRVGLEDNLHFDAARTVLATNEGLVGRLAEFAARAGRPLATPAEARRLLGLPPAEAGTAPQTAQA